MIKFNVTMLKISLFIVTFLFFLFSASAFAQESRFYKLNLVSTQEKLQLKDIAVFPGSISAVPSKGDYRYDLLSFTGLVLHSDHFNVPPSTRSIRIFDPETGNSTFESIEQNSISITLGIPYFPNGKEIEVYDPQNKKILTIPVVQFAEITPTPISPTPQYKVTKLEKGISVPWIIGGGILLFVIIAIGIFVYLKFKKPQNPLS